MQTSLGAKEPTRLTLSEHVPREQTGTIMPTTARFITAHSLYWPDPYPTPGRALHPTSHLLRTLCMLVYRIDKKWYVAVTKSMAYSSLVHSPRYSRCSIAYFTSVTTNAECRIGHNDTPAGATGCILNVVLSFASMWFSAFVTWKWLWALVMDKRVPNLMCQGFDTLTAGTVRLLTAVGCPKIIISIILISITFSFGSVLAGFSIFRQVLLSCWVIWLWVCFHLHHGFCAMPIFLRVLGVTCVLIVCPSDSIDEVRVQLHRRLGIPAENCLMYQAKLLVDGCVQDYDTIKDCTLDLILNLQDRKQRAQQLVHCCTHVCTHFEVSALVCTHLHRLPYIHVSTNMCLHMYLCTLLH